MLEVSNQTLKTKERAEIEAQIKAFKKAGGKIDIKKSKSLSHKSFPAKDVRVNSLQ